MPEFRLRKIALFASLMTFGLTPLSFVASETARADFFLHHWELMRAPAQTLTLDGDLLIYSTSTNYDASGNQTAVPLLASYARTEFDVTGVYGITDSISLFGRLAWDRVQVNLTTANSGTAYGLGDQSLGASWRVWENKKVATGDYGIAIDAQVQADVPAYNNATTEVNDVPGIGDQSLDLTAGGFVTMPISQNRENAFLLVAGAGFTYRSQAFSSAIPWSVDVRWVPKPRGLTISVAGVGEQSLKNDPNADNLGLRGPNYTGGSFITNAINPSLASVRGSLMYDFNPRFSAKLSYETSLWGQDAPEGSLFTVGVKYVLGGGASSRANSVGPVNTIPAVGKTREPEIADTDAAFVKYSLEAKVQRTNDRLNLVRIDKGLNDGVEVGQYFDIFSTKPGGGEGEVVARGQVIAVKASDAAISVKEFYREVLIDEGFVARRLVR